MRGIEYVVKLKKNIKKIRTELWEIYSLQKQVKLNLHKWQTANLDATFRSVRFSIELKGSSRPCKLLQCSRKWNFTLLLDFYIRRVRMNRPTENFTLEVVPAMQTEIHAA